MDFGEIALWTVGDGRSTGHNAMDRGKVILIADDKGNYL